MRDDFKACPCLFCNSENLCLLDVHGGAAPLFYVECRRCWAAGPMKETAEGALAAWDKAYCQVALIRDQRDAMEDTVSGLKADNLALEMEHEALLADVAAERVEYEEHL